MLIVHRPAWERYSFIKNKINRLAICAHNRVRRPCKRWDTPEQTLVSQREALQRATAAAEAAQQQLHAQADQEAKRTTGIQALQQHVTQELATAITQKVVTLQPAPDRLTLRVRSETLFRPGTVALRSESRDIVEQIAAALHTVPDSLNLVDVH